MSEFDTFVSSAPNFNVIPSDHTARSLETTARLSTRDRLAWLGGLGRHESRQHRAPEDRFVFPVASWLQAWKSDVYSVPTELDEEGGESAPPSTRCGPIVLTQEQLYLHRIAPVVVPWAFHVEVQSDVPCWTHLARILRAEATRSQVIVRSVVSRRGRGGFGLSPASRISLELRSARVTRHK